MDEEESDSRRSAGWSVYAKLAQDNERFLWGILSDLASKAQGRNTNQQTVGDYLAACMDESAIEKLGAAPNTRVHRRDPRNLYHKCT